MNKKILLFLAVCAISASLMAKKHPLYDVVCAEIDATKKDYPNQFFIRESLTPHLYAFLMPVIQKICTAGNIPIMPKLLMNTDSPFPTNKSFNIFAHNLAVPNNQAVFYGEGLLKLYFYDEIYTPCIPITLGHEAGHIFHFPNKSEPLADAFSAKIMPDSEQFANALTLSTLASILFAQLHEILHQEDITNVVIKTTHALFPLIQKTVTPLIKKEIPGNLFFEELIETAISLIKRNQQVEDQPVDNPLVFEQELIQALTVICSNKPYIKKLIRANKDPEDSPYPSLYKRIELFKLAQAQASS
jgi:hypothetical protein